MNLLELFREAMASALASRVSSALVALVAAATCLAALLTVGQQAAAERRLAEEFAKPAARTLTLTDDDDAGLLTGPMLATLRTLQGTSTVLGIGTPVDGINGLLGNGSSKVSLVSISGDTDDAVRLVQGRAPRPGEREVLVSERVQRALGMELPSGVIEDADATQWSVVGAFQPVPPFDELADHAIHIDPDPAAPLRRVRLVADSVSAVPAVQEAALGVVAAPSGGLAIESATSAAATSTSAQQQLTQFGRSLLLLILGAGAFFVAVVVLADVLIHRRDLGRRRTLGIWRSDLVALVALRTALPAAIGAGLASAAGMLLGPGAVPPGFAVSVAVLATITAVLASVPPALVAAWRDPVAVMRTA